MFKYFLVLICFLCFRNGFTQTVEVSISYTFTDVKFINGDIHLTDNLNRKMCKLDSKTGNCSFRIPLEYTNAKRLALTLISDRLKTNLRTTAEKNGNKLICKFEIEKKDLKTIKMNISLDISDLNDIINLSSSDFQIYIEGEDKNRPYLFDIKSQKFHPEIPVDYLVEEEITLVVDNHLLKNGKKNIKIKNSDFSSFKKISLDKDDFDLNTPETGLPSSRKVSFSLKLLESQSFSDPFGRLSIEIYKKGDKVKTESVDGIRKINELQVSSEVDSIKVIVNSELLHRRQLFSILRKEFDQPYNHQIASNDVREVKQTPEVIIAQEQSILKSYYDLKLKTLDIRSLLLLDFEVFIDSIDHILDKTSSYQKSLNLIDRGELSFDELELSQDEIIEIKKDLQKQKNIFKKHLKLIDSQQISEEMQEVNENIKNLRGIVIMANIPLKKKDSILTIINSTREKLNQKDSLYIANIDRLSLISELYQEALKDNNNTLDKIFLKQRIKELEQKISNLRKEKGEVEQKLKELREIETELKVKLAQQEERIWYFRMSTLILSIISTFLFLILWWRQRKHSKKLNTKNKQIEGIQKSRQNLIAMLAHDMNNALNIILAKSDIDTHHKLSIDEAIKNFQSIYASGSKINLIRDNILSINVKEFRGISLQKDDYNLYNLVNDIIQEQYFFIETRSLKVFNQIPLDTVCEFDRDYISRVFENLLNNAIRFNEIGGSIFFNANQVDKQDKAALPEYLQKKQLIKISIRDTGVGIPENKKEDIFKAFNQLSRPKEEGGYTQNIGLGLAFCKMVIEEHNSIIQLESEENKGAIFYFYLEGTSSDCDENKEDFHRENIEKLSPLKESSKKYLQKYLKELENIPFYKRWQLQEFIENIDAKSNAEIENWLVQTLDSINKRNEKRFNELKNILYQS